MAHAAPQLQVDLVTYRHHPDQINIRQSVSERSSGTASIGHGVSIRRPVCTQHKRVGVGPTKVHASAGCLATEWLRAMRCRPSSLVAESGQQRVSPEWFESPGKAPRLPMAVAYPTAHSKASPLHLNLPPPQMHSATAVTEWIAQPLIVPLTRSSCRRGCWAV